MSERHKITVDLDQSESALVDEIVRDSVIKTTRTAVVSMAITLGLKFVLQATQKRKPENESTL